jgi:hypothetical protein
LIRPSEFRGTNYLPSTGTSLQPGLGLLPKQPQFGFVPKSEGFFDPGHARQELAALAGRGLNTIRLWPSFYGWVADRQGYMQSLRGLAQACVDAGVGITYILWSTTLANEGGGEVHQLAPSLAPEVVFQVLWELSLVSDRIGKGKGWVPHAEPWQSSLHSEPGNGLFREFEQLEDWPLGLSVLVDEYLRELAAFFGQDPVGRQAFASYDLFNEADVLWTKLSDATSSQVAAVKDRFHRFVGTCWQTLVQLQPGAEFTVGWASELAALSEELTAAVGPVETYLSFHNYGQPDRFRDDATRHKAFADSLGLPLVCSEFWEARLPPIAGYLQVLKDLQVAGQMWGFLETNHFWPLSDGVAGPIDGIVRPVAGTVPQWQEAGWPSDVPCVVTRPDDEAAIRDWAAGS